MITRRQRLQLKREVAEEKPLIWIGKNGVTEEVIKEVSNQLERNQVVKIKILKTIIKTSNIKELAEEIVDKTGSTLIDARGHNLVIYKMNKKQEDMND